MTNQKAIEIRACDPACPYRGIVGAQNIKSDAATINSWALVLKEASIWQEGGTKQIIGPQRLVVLKDA